MRFCMADELNRRALPIHHTPDTLKIGTQLLNMVCLFQWCVLFMCLIKLYTRAAVLWQRSISSKLTNECFLHIDLDLRVWGMATILVQDCPYKPDLYWTWHTFCLATYLHRLVSTCDDLHWLWSDSKLRLDHKSSMCACYLWLFATCNVPLASCMQSRLSCRVCLARAWKFVYSLPRCSQTLR